MTLKKSQDPKATDPDPESEETQELQRGGAGAASALQRMKADHALRRRHGPRTAGTGHEDDRTPEP